MGPSNRDEGKMGICDIVFIILLVLMLLFLIPFYSSILDILKLASQFMVGADTYIGLLGFILGFFMMFLGFKYRNSVIKIFGLLLMFSFLLSPFYGYLGNYHYLKESLGKYTYKGLEVILPDDCMVEKKEEPKNSNTFESGMDSNFSFFNNSSSWKDKMKCMSTETHYVYKISYRNDFQEEKMILFDGKENFDKMMRVQSYEIVYEKMGDYFSSIKGIGKVDYQFKISISGKGILDLDRSTVINEYISFPSPHRVNLSNFYQDSRLILYVKFQTISNQDKVHKVITELEEKSENDFPVIVNYGNKKEYYLRGLWYNFSEKELISKLIRDE